MSIYTAGTYTLVEAPAGAVHIQVDGSPRALCGTAVSKSWTRHEHLSVTPQATDPARPGNYCQGCWRARWKLLD
jgi:hypothetical protein